MELKENIRFDIHVSDIDHVIAMLIELKKMYGGNTLLEYEDDCFPREISHFEVDENCSSEGKRTIRMR